jgi:hypothetical protein
MMRSLPGSSAPLEIRLAALVSGVGGLLFLTGALAWGLQVPDLSVATVPGVDAVVGLVLGAGLLAGLRFARMPALVWAGLMAMLQAVLALGYAPVWLRVLCGFLAAAHVYLLVLLNTAPARSYFGAPR